MFQKKHGHVVVYQVHLTLIQEMKIGYHMMRGEAWSPDLRMRNKSWSYLVKGLTVAENEIDGALDEAIFKVMATSPGHREYLEHHKMRPCRKQPCLP